ncbi:MAG: 2-enoyl thioester reductase domain-containing protein [Candidatus Omnitrophica bacterium]|nr:2-enoyl thioester reductase domain-containing protein [Candidatus Omnitrophota bacterium]
MNYKGLCIHEHGAPNDVIRIEPLRLPHLNPHDVLIEMNASPINPADINLIEGKYPVPVSFPLIPGNEGIGRIAQVGGEVEGLRVGQAVIPGPKSTSWCEAQIQDSRDVIPVPDDIPLHTASMLSVNPTTAWRLLHDFIDLKPGDWVVQNAANSALGQCVIQIAHYLGLKTCNLVRREELIEPLMKLGATTVIASEDPRMTDILDRTGGAEIHLGINAVGGRSVVEMAKALAPQSTIVTVGAMGMRPMKIPNGLLIFKNITFAGFWLKIWSQNSSREQNQEMFDAILGMAAQGKLQVPVEATYPLEEAVAAIQHASKGSRNGKILFEMNHRN